MSLRRSIAVRLTLLFAIVATLVRESPDQAPIECGWLRAYCLTDSGARRSELPSRSTGLTALPFTLS